MTEKFKKIGEIDELVQYVTLHLPNPVILNGTIFPFLILYFGWVYWFFLRSQTDEEAEASTDALLISLAVIACIQILTCLCCFWSVHIQTFLNCRKVDMNLHKIFR